MHQVLNTCPVCAGELSVTRLRCGACATSIEGEFTLGRLGRLSREQLTFVELLVKNRGNINQVAEALKVSYTTARTRMDEVVAALGYAPAGEEPEADRLERLEIFKRVQSGEISPDEALRLIKR